MKRIAVVDDDQDYLDVVAEVFLENGWRIIPFTRTADVLEQLAPDPPDLAIVDVYMETRHAGWDLIEALRGNERTRHIPIIVCSAASRELNQRAAWLRERDINVLEKPFDVEDLQRLARKMVSALPSTSVATGGE